MSNLFRQCTGILQSDYSWGGVGGGGWGGGGQAYDVWTLVPPHVPCIPVSGIVHAPAVLPTIYGTRNSGCRLYDYNVHMLKLFGAIFLFNYNLFHFNYLFILICTLP